MQVLAVRLDPFRPAFRQIVPYACMYRLSALDLFILTRMWKSLTLGYDDLALYIGPGTAPLDHSKNCAAHITLKYPADYQFGVLGTTYHGYVALEKTEILTLQSTYGFSSSNFTSSDRVSITGTGEDYVFTLKATDIDPIGSPCASTIPVFNVNFRMTLTTTTSSGTGQVPPDDEPYASWVQQIHMGWQTCG
jgi:hypothetical protein